MQAKKEKISRWCNCAFSAASSALRRNVTLSKSLGIFTLTVNQSGVSAPVKQLKHNNAGPSFKVLTYAIRRARQGCCYSGTVLLGTQLTNGKGRNAIGKLYRSVSVHCTWKSWCQQENGALVGTGIVHEWDVGQGMDGWAGRLGAVDNRGYAAIETRWVWLKGMVLICGDVYKIFNSGI